MAMQHHRRDHILPVGEDVGLDLDDVADDAFGGKTPGIHSGRDTFNDDATASVKRGFEHELAWCELHASAQRALCGHRIVQLEKKLLVAAEREHVLVSGGLFFGPFEELEDNPLRLSEVHRRQCPIVGN